MKKTAKSNMPNATLRIGNLPPAEAVRNAKVDVGAAARAIATQLENDQVKGTSSSGKKRSRAVWGIPADNKEQ